MKYIPLLLLLLISCKKDDESGCYCKGQFVDENNNNFFAYNVDCETGKRRDGTSIDAFFLGCED